MLKYKVSGNKSAASSELGVNLLSYRQHVTRRRHWTGRKLSARLNPTCSAALSLKSGFKLTKVSAELIGLVVEELRSRLNSLPQFLQRCSWSDFIKLSAQTQWRDGWCSVKRSASGWDKTAPTQWVPLNLFLTFMLCRNKLLVGGALWTSGKKKSNISGGHWLWISFQISCVSQTVLLFSSLWAQIFINI